MRLIARVDQRAAIHRIDAHHHTEKIGALRYLIDTRLALRAFGLDAGVLAPGKVADLVLLRRDTLAFTPRNDVMSQLVFCENGSSVDTVIVNGEVVVEDGRLKKLDEKEVLTLATKARDRLNPAIEREMAAAKTLEPALAEMYFQIFRGT